MTEKVVQKKNILTYIIFFFTFTIVLINIIPLIFPALISESLIKSENTVNPFELGVWAIPLILVNLSILIFSILYFKNLVPRSVQNPIKFILTFEVSKRITVIVLLLILGLYVILTIPELTVYEGNLWSDFKKIEDRIETFPYNANNELIKQSIVKYSLLLTSETLFQNMSIIPFMASIALLVLTYLFTFEITKKRFAGLISMVILLQSYTFLRYDTTATYSNFWTLFYLLSLYLIHKKWYISSIPFILSILSKPISLMYIPVNFFHIFISDFSTKKKIYTSLPYIIIIFILIGVAIEGSFSENLIEEFSEFDFWTGFTAFAFGLRFDSFILLFILPLIVGLLLVSQKGIKESNSISILIGWILLTSPILMAITYHDVHAYRFIPLIVFFAIGFGTFFSKKLTQQA